MHAKEKAYEICLHSILPVSFMRYFCSRVYFPCKNQQHPPPLPTPEELEAEQEVEVPPAWNEPPCHVAIQGLEVSALCRDSFTRD